MEQVLVKWKWKGVEDATLMNLSDFQGQFPYFSLKDNTDSQQESNDNAKGSKTKIFKVYFRRREKQNAHN